MDITKVKEAWETIHEAERELEQIVKRHLETAETIEANFLSPLPEKEDFNDFLHEFQEGELTIQVEFWYSGSTGEYHYRISCQEYEIYYHEPPTSSKSAAQGTLNVKYEIETKKGIKEATKLISLVEYQQ